MIGNLGKTLHILNKKNNRRYVILLGDIWNNLSNVYRFKLL